MSRFKRRRKSSMLAAMLSCISLVSTMTLEIRGSPSIESAEGAIVVETATVYTTTYIESPSMVAVSSQSTEASLLPIPEPQPEPEPEPSAETTTSLVLTDDSSSEATPTATQQQPPSETSTGLLLTSDTTLPLASSTSLPQPLPAGPSVSLSSSNSSAKLPPFVISVISISSAYILSAPSATTLQTLPSLYSGDGATTDTALSLPSFSGSSSSPTSSTSNAQYITSVPVVPPPSLITISIRPAALISADAALGGTSTSSLKHPPPFASLPSSSGASYMATFMLTQTTTPSPTAQSASQSSSGRSSSSSTTPAAQSTAHAVSSDGISSPVAASERTTRPNASIIGGVVGGGIGAVALATAAIFIVVRRRRRDRQSKPQRISSWDFIDGRRGARRSSDRSFVGVPRMSYFDQPNLAPPIVARKPVPESRNANSGLWRTDDGDRNRYTDIIIGYGERNNGGPVNGSRQETNVNRGRNTMSPVYEGLEPETREAMRFFDTRPWPRNI